MQLAFKRYGGGPPLLILHGLLGAGGNWHTLSSNVFGQHFTVFTVDLRNHGRSPHADVFDYPSMVADLVEFLDTHDLPQAHVLGHSMGGKAAMHLALAHPARVDRLVVVDMAPRAYPPHHTEILEALGALDLDALGSRGAIDAALAHRIPSTPIRQFLLKNLDYRDGRYGWKMNLPAIHRNYAQINTPIEPGATFEGPALFVRGGASDYVEEADVPAIRALFPEAEIETIDGAGHWVHAEQPDALAETVVGFLRS